MSKLEKTSAGRYQNISPIQVSILKERQGEMKSKSIPPGRVVDMTDDEIQASKDSHIRREDNPFDRGMMKEIPEGESEHPEKIDLGRHISKTEAERLFLDVDYREVKKSVKQVMDKAGITKLRRLVMMMEEDGKIVSDRATKLGNIIDDQEDNVEKEMAKRERKFGL